jgi:hypothetical protein
MVLENKNLILLSANRYLGHIHSNIIKAFDSIPHRLLFYRLLNGELHGKVVNVLRNMYSKLKSCVNIDGFLTEDFSCSVGTRQGCMLSPFLFIFYLNELLHIADVNNCQGVYLNELHPNITMYADDLVIVGDQVGRVQKVLNTLAEFCKKWGLQVNMSKTNSMVFRKGGIVKRNEVFYFDGTKLDNVSYYKYLGVIISTRLSWSPAQTTLSLQASKAMNLINQVNYRLEYSYKTACTIFDKCVLPVLSYGSEIWGTDVHKSSENVHIKFLKMLLGVGSRTPTPAVLGECGRDRIYVSCLIKCIKYWLKLLSLPPESLLKSSYMFLYNQCLAGKTNWASKVRDLLCQYGFGWIWENQSVPDVEAFLKIFSERVRDCELQWWSSECEKNVKVRIIL